MKKNSFFAMAASLMVGLASCSTDAPDEPGKVLPDETRTFVKISLVSNIGADTRQGEGEFADDLFEVGEEEENKINKLLLVFYDQSETYVGSTETLVSKSYSDGNADLTIAKVLTAVAEVNLPENSNQPAYVVAFANPTTQYTDLFNKVQLSDLIHVLRGNGTMSKDGLTMNNSVYYNEDLGVPQFATPVDFSTQFFKTAEDASNAPAINIFVERVQAKVRLNDFDEINPQPFVSNEEGEYTLEFVPENWFANATEKSTFLLKNYRLDEKNFPHNATNAAFDDLMSFSYVQNCFRNGKDLRMDQFNEERRKRSYWALSPTYFFTGDEQYPAISYDVKNGSINSQTGRDFNLEYLSYRQGVAGDVRKWQYCLENTMNLATLKSGRAKSAMTSVVLLGHYVIKNKAGEVVFDGSSNTGTFYVRHDSDNSKTVLLNDKEVINYFLERTGNLIYYPVSVIDEDGTPTGDVEYQPLRAAHAEAYNLYSDFALAHPLKISNELVGQSVVSEQWRTLKFADGAQLGRYYIYEHQEDGSYKYVKLTSAKLQGILKNMMSAYGMVESFKEGKAYFNVPLKHIFYNANLYDHKNPNSNVLDAENVQLGDYGVVRNHVYSLTINRITGLGTGIGDLDQPIVPPTEVDKYYISAKINILKWRVVSQSVDL